MRDKLAIEVEAAFREQPEHIGIKVGMLCNAGNVPISFVAGVVGVTPVSVYRWLTGVATPKNRGIALKLRRLEYTLHRAIQDSILPMQEFEMGKLLPLWKQSKIEVK
jgi:hypothetical protein